jgi:hypothetical protein
MRNIAANMQPVLQTRYDRNNRSNGSKGLRYIYLLNNILYYIVNSLPFRRRCFPSCKIAGHSHKGFCGQKIELVLGFQEKDFDVLLTHDLISVAEMRPFGVAGLGSQHIVQEDEILKNIRNKQKPLLPYLPGKITLGSLSDCSIQYNTECNAWHYGWKSHKWNTNTTHVVEFTLFMKIGGGQLELVGSYSSPGFVISCAKRKKKVIER